MGRGGVKIPWVGGSIYHGYGGQYTHTMDRRGGQNTMGKGGL